MKGKNVVGVNVEEYRSLVAMLAWRAWRRLPMHIRTWIAVDDMIEDGMAEIFKLSKSYNPKWANFSTAAYHKAHNLFINNYLEHYSARQRGWVRESKAAITEGRPIPHHSIQALQEAMQGKFSKATIDDVVSYIPALVVSEDSILNNVMTECFVIPMLEKIYKQASPKLQDAMVGWFLAKEGERVNKKGKPFKQASKEFRELAYRERVTCGDCIHLVRSPGCLDVFSRHILGIPYNLEHPTPVVERIL